jgi:hypothetical protein
MQYERLTPFPLPFFVDTPKYKWAGDASPGERQDECFASLAPGEQDRGPDFLRLANALSALYPKQSEEKRLLDAMLLAVPR